MKREENKPRAEMTPEAIKRYAERATKPSAKLEGRDVPEGHVRSPRVEAILARRKPRRD